MNIENIAPVFESNIMWYVRGVVPEKGKSIVFEGGGAIFLQFPGRIFQTTSNYAEKVHFYNKWTSLKLTNKLIYN